MKRGGDELIVETVLIPRKAWRQYCAINPGEEKRALEAAMLGATVRRMADDSPYFLAEFGDMRYVFCVRHNQPRENGNLTLVAVQMRFPKHK